MQSSAADRGRGESAEESVHFRALLEQAPAFVFLARGEPLAIAFANGVFLEVAGVDEAVGRALGPLLGDEWNSDAEHVLRTGAARQGRSRIVDGRAFDVLFLPQRDGHGAVDGVLAFGFDVTEKVRLEAENARLLRAEQTAARRASILQQITVALTEAHGVGEIARITVEAGRELLEAESALIWMIDGKDGDLVLAAASEVPDAFVGQWRRIRSDDELPAARAVRDGGPIWVSSTDEYRRVAPAVLDRALEAGRPTAYTAVPLILEGRAIGLVVYGFRAPHTFSEDEKQLIVTMCGHAGQAIERARLVEAQERAIVALRTIAHVGEMLSSSLEIEATLTTLARSCVPDLADWCAVDLLVRGEIQRLTVAHMDPDKLEWARTVAERWPARLGDGGGVARAFETGEVLFVPHVTPEMITAANADPERREALLALGVRSCVLVPLKGERGRVEGVVTFVQAESGRVYTEADRDLLVEIGRRASIALTNAALYEREQRARDRMTRLQAVTAGLARAISTIDVGEVICREGTAALGSDVAALHAVVDARLKLLAHHRFDLRLADLPLDLETPIARAARTGAKVEIAGHAELAAAFPRFESELGAYLCKPLFDGSGSVAAVLTFGFHGNRTFTDEERGFARALADHCGQAFERASSVDRERRARERLALLAAAGEAFSKTLDYQPTLNAVVRISMPELADFAFFDLVESDGVRRTSEAYEDPEVAAILAQSQWVKSERTDLNLCALSTGHAALHSHIDEPFLRDMATNEGHLEVLRKLRLCSMITVPVVTRGETIGALTLCYGRSGRHHTSDDLDLAQELARRGAVAVEQARLYRASQEAAERAEEANRFKDEFLATVSHELRTPLNAIVGWARMLEPSRLGDTAFVSRGVEVIRRNALAQSQIVEDILDVSRVTMGKLRLEVLAVDMANVVRDAIEVVRPSAESKGVRLEAPRIDSPAMLVGDAARLQQLVWNLLSNALKFTPRGGAAVISLSKEGPTIVVRVKDTGQGIAPEFLPFVFDRFKQADSSSTRAHGGLGLGLALVKHIAELHGGQVRAESEGAGHGATFEVSLPVRAVVAADRETLSGTAEARPLAKRSVLVVDDDDDARDLVAEVLRSAGADVIVAASAGEAVALYERHAIDILVSDIGMPVVDGYELMRMIRGAPKAQDLRAIALTAYSAPEDRAAAASAGFDAHLAKPTEPAELVKTAVALVRSHAPSPSRTTATDG
jgi:signal transduction histidine kinase/ActR/RegA family two-component response regulator